MRAMKWIAIGCMLFGGRAFGHDDTTREFVNDWLLRTAMDERGFEQVLASHVSDTNRLPPSGPLDGGYLTLLSHATKPKNAFKLATWALCVSPKPAADGTVLIVTSVQHPQENGPPHLEIRYRTMVTPGEHTPHTVWPYAVVIVHGWHDTIVCRAVR